MGSRRRKEKKLRGDRKQMPHLTFLLWVDTLSGCLTDRLSVNGICFCPEICEVAVISVPSCIRKGAQENQSLQSSAL